MHKVRYLATRRDLIFAGIYLVLAVLAANCLFWHGMNLGLGVAAAALALSAIIYLRRKLDGYGIVCLAGAVACGLSLGWSGDTTVKLLALCTAILLATCAVIQQMQLWQRGKGSFRFVGDLVRFSIGVPLGRCGDVLWAIFHKAGPEGTPVHRRTGSVLLGILCALPVLVVLIPLLMRSDAAFEGLLDRLDLGTAMELLGSLILGAGTFLVLFSQGFLLPRYQSPPTAARTPAKGIGPVALGSFLGAICALYMLYLVSQLAYFFSGFGGILPEGYTTAQYARRGFFEMAIVCALNLLLLFGALLTSAKPRGREPVAIRVLGLFLCGFSLVLIATALSKMVLYIDTYGMTRLRILTAVFMVFLAVCFICMILRLLVRRFGYMQPILLAGAALVLVLSFGNCDRFIANYNYDAWQTGRLEQLDVAHIGSLGPAAVPVLWEIAQEEDQDLALQGRVWLTEQANVWLVYDGTQSHVLDAETTTWQYIPHVEAAEEDIRSYNRDAVRAVELLMEHYGEYYVPDHWEYMGLY